MSKELYEAAMETFIDDYMDEHPDADWTEAYSAWCHVDQEYTTDFIADRADAAWQRQKDSRI